MISSGKEQRKHSRLPIDLEYVLIIDDCKYMGRINSLSLSGAYLATSEPELPISCVLKQGNLNINTGNGWFLTRCSVVYAGDKNSVFPGGAGVAFCQHDEQTATAIWNIAIQYLLQDNNLFAPIT